MIYPACIPRTWIWTLCKILYHSSQCLVYRLSLLETCDRSNLVESEATLLWARMKHHLMIGTWSIQSDSHPIEPAMLTIVTGRHQEQSSQSPSTTRSALLSSLSGLRYPRMNLYRGWLLMCVNFNDMIRMWSIRHLTKWLYSMVVRISTALAWRSGTHSLSKILQRSIIMFRCL